ncbi:hypothetical protein [Carboxydothermus ferrireducens]|uniref:Uncharacterized protein n=1 Tax=Carboxydothermus ferrireducens DSM 11255 TaxID=1119529 RepID=A0ABX2RAM8_9THEO|nr:hypothetical protein [Carboxydothermus ferrireducens]NYE57191.1 hypothetical protein [Carboxydothermus ferrireducens DSM 11255]
MVAYLQTYPNRERAIVQKILNSRALKNNLKEVVVMYPGMGYIKIELINQVNSQYLKISGVLRVLEEVNC